MKSIETDEKRNHVSAAGTIRREKMEKFAKGSLTIEAALVMPVVIYCVALLTVFLLFLYNRSVMTDAALLGVGQVFYEEEDILNLTLEKRIKEKCTEALCDRLVGMEDIHMTVSVGKFQSNVKITGTLKIATILSPGFEIPFQTVEVRARADRLRSGQFIRNLRKGEKLKDWITERIKEQDETRVQTGYEPQLPDSAGGEPLLPAPDVLQQ